MKITIHYFFDEGQRNSYFSNFKRHYIDITEITKILRKNTKNKREKNN